MKSRALPPVAEVRGVDQARVEGAHVGEAAGRDAVVADDTVLLVAGDRHGAGVDDVLAGGVLALARLPGPHGVGVGALGDGGARGVVGALYLDGRVADGADAGVAVRRGGGAVELGDGGGESRVDVGDEVLVQLDARRGEVDGADGEGHLDGGLEVGVAVEVALHDHDVVAGVGRPADVGLVDVVGLVDGDAVVGVVEVDAGDQALAVGDEGDVLGGPEEHLRGAVVVDGGVVGIGVGAVDDVDVVEGAAHDLELDERGVGYRAAGGLDAGVVGARVDDGALIRDPVDLGAVAERGAGAGLCVDDLVVGVALDVDDGGAGLLVGDLGGDHVLRLAVVGEGHVGEVVEAVAVLVVGVGDLARADLVFGHGRLELDVAGGRQRDHRGRADGEDADERRGDGATGPAPPVVGASCHVLSPFKGDGAESERPVRPLASRGRHPANVKNLTGMQIFHMDNRSHGTARGAPSGDAAPLSPMRGPAAPAGAGA